MDTRLFQQLLTTKGAYRVFYRYEACYKHSEEDYDYVGNVDAYRVVVDDETTLCAKSQESVVLLQQAQSYTYEQSYDGSYES